MALGSDVKEIATNRPSEENVTSNIADHTYAPIIVHGKTNREAALSSGEKCLARVRTGNSSAAAQTGVVPLLPPLEATSRPGKFDLVNILEF